MLDPEKRSAALYVGLSIEATLEAAPIITSAKP